MNDSHYQRWSSARARILMRKRAWHSTLVAAQTRVGELTAAAADAPSLSDADIDDMLGRVESLIDSLPEDEVGDREEFRRALDTLIACGDPALRKLVFAPSPRPLSLDELTAVESLVVVDGSRPSFLLRNGQIAADHPFIGQWSDEIATFAARQKAVASAVGRIQPSGGHSSNYIGTGTVVRNDGVVITNYHVIDDARTKKFIAMTDMGQGRLRVDGDLFIDFDAEVSVASEALFKIVDVQLPEGAGRTEGSVDFAVLRIEPYSLGVVLPSPVVVSADSSFASGGSATFATIGFPGRPKIENVEGAKIDWNWVVATLFGNRFGVKRMAPGEFVAPPGTEAWDTRKIVFRHDATTFDGASGSLLCAWDFNGAPTFGIHVRGRTGYGNFALATSKLAVALRKLGVPLT